MEIDHLPVPGGYWCCGHPFEQHKDYHEADACMLRQPVASDFPQRVFVRKWPNNALSVYSEPCEGAIAYEKETS